jgi:hypothetical protein
LWPGGNLVILLLVGWDLLNLARVFVTRVIRE